MSYNASDPRDVAKRTKDEKAALRRYENSLRWVLSQPHGREFFWNFLSASGVFSNPFATDPYTTAFNAGRMNEGQRILADINRVAPELYAKMQEEANARSDPKPESDEPVADRPTIPGPERG